jgi:outer membrane biosynthesis protein TonB
MANFSDKKGLIGTILFHGIIVALLFLSFKAPVEEDPGGILVNFGTEAEGSGEIEPMENNAENYSAPDAGKTSESTEEEVLTQDDEADFEHADVHENESVNNLDNNQDNNNNNNVTSEENQQEINENMLFPGRDPNSDNRDGQGNTQKTGNQGNINGDPNADNYGNRSFGTGIAYSLAGRTSEVLPQPSKNFQEEGIVVVKVYVDKYGNVTRAQANAKGTNVPDGSILRRLAKEAAMKSKFSKKLDGAVEQMGTITYTFRLQ